MKNRQKRVLVALGWYDYRLHRGIERYALEHQWNLSANLAREKVIPWGWEGDGILAWLGAHALVAFLIIGLGRLFDGNYWLSALIVSVLLIVPGALLAKRGLNRLKTVDPSLPNTMNSVQDDKLLIQGKVVELKQAATPHIPEFKLGNRERVS